MFICSAWLLLGVSKPSTPPGRALSNPQLPLSAHGDLSSISPVGITYARCGSPGNEPKTEKKKHIQEKHVSWFEKQWEQIHSRVWAWLWESGREHVCSIRAVVLDFPSFVIFVFLKIFLVIFFLHFPDWADCQVLFFFVQNATLFASLDNLTEKNFHFLS